MSPSLRSVSQSLLTGIILLCITHISSNKAIDCLNAFQCVGEHINTTVTQVMDGYKAAATPNTTIHSTSSMWCRGAFSCHSASLISSESLKCYGSSACANVNHIASDDIWCSGFYSCAYSTIIGTGTNSVIGCTAHKACANSHISGIQTISSASAYSLHNVTIDSLHVVGNLTATIRGYHAAVNAKLICRIGNICIINCYANACYMFHIDCIGACIIKTQSNDTIYPVFTQMELILDLEHDLPQTSASNDALCKDPATITYDDDLQTAHSLITTNGTNETLCCRGTRSCSLSDIIDMHLIVCSAQAACQDQDPRDNIAAPRHNITNNAAIYCEGSGSCMYSTVHASDAVYCVGQESCARVTIHGALHVFCAGYWSCRVSNINTKGFGDTYHIYFIGVQSGKNVKYHCKMNDECIIYCGARDACPSDLIITCDGTCTVFCDTDSSCPGGYTRNLLPTANPTLYPTVNSTNNPTLDPTNNPTLNPTNNPTVNPTRTPTTLNPTPGPTVGPTTNNPAAMIIAKSPSDNSYPTAAASTLTENPSIVITGTATTVNDRREDILSKDSIIIIVVLCGSLLVICGMIVVYIRCKKQASVDSDTLAKTIEEPAVTNVASVETVTNVASGGLDYDEKDDMKEHIDTADDSTSDSLYVKYETVGELLSQATVGEADNYNDEVGEADIQKTETSGVQTLELCVTPKDDV